MRLPERKGGAEHAMMTLSRAEAAIKYPKRFETSQWHNVGCVCMHLYKFCVCVCNTHVDTHIAAPGRDLNCRHKSGTQTSIFRTFPFALPLTYITFDTENLCLPLRFKP